MSHLNEWENCKTNLCLVKLITYLVFWCFPVGSGNTKVCITWTFNTFSHGTHCSFQGNHLKGHLKFINPVSGNEREQWIKSNSAVAKYWNVPLWVKKYWKLQIGQQKCLSNLGALFPTVFWRFQNIGQHPHFHQEQICKSAISTSLFAINAVYRISSKNELKNWTPDFSCQADNVCVRAPFLENSWETESRRKAAYPALLKATSKG